MTWHSAKGGIMATPSLIVTWIAEQETGQKGKKEKRPEREKKGRMQQIKQSAYRVSWQKQGKKAGCICFTSKRLGSTQTRTDRG